MLWSKLEEAYRWVVVLFGCGVTWVVDNNVLQFVAFTLSVSLMILNIIIAYPKALDVLKRNKETEKEQLWG